MKYGVTMFVTDETVDPASLAAAAEERGFVSLYVPEHTHIPVSRLTPAPTGGDLGPEYTRCLDPWVALMAAGAATERMLLGSGIALVAQHHPINLAKQVATVDHLTGGRAMFGIGFGWNREEMADHGVDYATRRARVREHVLAIKALWSAEEAGFEGEFVSFEPTWSWPKPVRGAVPILIGGAAGPKLFEHVAEYADGWIPIGGAGLTETLPRLRDAWAAAGRSGEPMVIPFGTIPAPGKLEHYEQLGITEVVLRVAGGDRDAALRRLDRLVESIPT